MQKKQEKGTKVIKDVIPALTESKEPISSEVVKLEEAKVEEVKAEEAKPKRVTKKTKKVIDAEGKIVAIFGFKMEAKVYEGFKRNKPEVNSAHITVVEDKDNDCVFLGVLLGNQTKTGGFYASFEEFQQYDAILDVYLRRSHDISGDAAVFVEFIES